MYARSYFLKPAVNDVEQPPTRHTDAARVANCKKFILSRMKVVQCVLTARTESTVASEHRGVMVELSRADSLRIHIGQMTAQRWNFIPRPPTIGSDTCQPIDAP